MIRCVHTFYTNAILLHLCQKGGTKAQGTIIIYTVLLLKVSEWELTSCRSCAEQVMIT